VEIDRHARLLDTERVALSLELGTGVRVVRADPGAGPRWVCRIDPDHDGPPVLRRRGELIESVAADVAGLMATFSFRHTWLRTGRDTTVGPCADLAGAVDRIVDEIGDSFPGFALRGAARVDCHLAGRSPGDLDRDADRTALRRPRLVAAAVFRRRLPRGSAVVARRGHPGGHQRGFRRADRL
jgi:hypothetical protein